MHQKDRNQKPSKQIIIPADPLLFALEEQLLPRLERRLVDLFNLNLRKSIESNVEVKRLYSLNDLAEIYGVGRTEATRLIREGKLLSVERRCRGGRMGTFVPREEAERCFAGKILQNSGTALRDENDR